MRASSNETKPNASTANIEIELETVLIEQLLEMEKFTKIPKSELLGTALKRFIASHKDYFPDDYKA